MASTALQPIQEPIAVGCYQKQVQELNDLICNHSPRFFRIALSHLGNVADAEDAVQDALLSALTHVGQFRGEAKMSTWLSAIVINSARMKLRRRSPAVHLALDDGDGQADTALVEMVADPRPGPEAEYRKREIAEILAHGVSRLSPTLRSTFELRDFHGLSIRETAYLLGVPRGTVKARLARARSRLREVIQKNGWEGGV